MRRMFIVVAAAATFHLQGCTTTEGAKDEKKPESGEAKESWLDKAEKNVSTEAKKAKEKGMPYYASCKAEIDKNCKTEEKDPTKLSDCVKKNKDKFGPTCKAAVEKHFKETNK